MRVQEYEQVRVISCKGHRWGEFEKDVNRAMQELSRARPELQIDLAEGIALIRYHARVEIAEDTRDRYRAQGVEFECRQCPECERPRDGRFKYVKCRYFDREVRWRGCACEEFYEWLKRGDVNPLMEEEDFR